MTLTNHWATSIVEGTMKSEALTWSLLLCLLSPNQLEYKK